MTIRDIIATIEINADDFRYFGIRYDDKVYAIGEDLDNSWHGTWLGDVDEPYELDGTCATVIPPLYFDGGQEDIDNVREALEINELYEGRAHRYIIAGNDDHTYGYDEGEIIIQNAVVIGIIF